MSEHPLDNECKLDYALNLIDEINEDWETLRAEYRREQYISLPMTILLIEENLRALELSGVDWRDLSLSIDWDEYQDIASCPQIAQYGDQSVTSAGYPRWPLEFDF